MVHPHPPAAISVDLISTRRSPSDALHATRAASRPTTHDDDLSASPCSDAPVTRSVTALAKKPQAPRHRYRVTYWPPAVAPTPAPRLSAFGHRCCSCPAAAAPLRRPAITLLASLRLAGGYLVTSCNTPEASPLALSLLLSPSRQRRLLLWPCSVPSARRLRHQLRSWLRRLRRDVARRPVLRGPPPLTCGEADGCDSGACRPARSRPCHPLHCASIRRLRGKPSRVPPPSCSITQVAHGQGKPAARDCRSKATSGSVRCAQVHSAGQR